MYFPLPCFSTKGAQSVLQGSDLLVVCSNYANLWDDIILVPVFYSRWLPIMFRFASMQSAKCFRGVVRFFFQEQTNELWTPSCPSKPFALPTHSTDSEGFQNDPFLCYSLNSKQHPNDFLKRVALNHKSTKSCKEPSHWIISRTFLHFLQIKSITPLLQLWIFATTTSTEY